MRDEWAMAPSFSSTMLQPQPQRAASSDSNSDAIRKRVCKACDRCRLKKSKCDGATPCSRCTADNAICVFGYVMFNARPKIADANE